MPRAKKPKEPQTVEIPGSYRFTDATINEADGEYEWCCEIMKQEPYPWMLGTDLTLIHEFGMANMRLEFHCDGKVKITKFGTSMKDHVANFDIRCMNDWCAKNGWNKPEVSRYAVLEMPEFWKHMWEVNIVECPYLESRYGKRPGDEPEPEEK